MKKQIETDGLISIDLDEEKEKKVKKQELEIKAGDLYIKIPADRSRIRECIAFLEVFEQQLEEPEVIQRPRERPTLTEINNEIQDTRQFLEDTQNQQRQIEAGFPFKNPVTQPLNLPNLNPVQPTIPFPVQTNQETTVLNDGQRIEKCPICMGKVKRKKVKQFQDGLYQEITCKNRHCSWKKVYKIAI